MARSISLMIPMIALAALSWQMPANADPQMKVQEVGSLAQVKPADLKPNTILFTDHRKDELVDPATGLIRFEDWKKANPLQARTLSLYPGYTEPKVMGSIDGVTKSYVQKLSMYVVEARFVLPKAADGVNLASYAALPFLAKIDPSIQHQAITAVDVIPASNPDYAYNKNPDRAWCASTDQTICIQSKYKLEGKLPSGIYLVNQLTEGKKHADYLEFQSELRVVPQADINQQDLKQLTGLDTPIAGVLEQNIFYVNQVMDFGRFVAVLQQHPSDPSQSIVTTYMTLAIKTKTIDRKKEFERVPVLRNLVPGQLLMGNSSFNTGTSLSAGLPSYTRNQIRAIAGIMTRG
jgi:hypothetical protein